MFHVRRHHFDGQLGECLWLRHCVLFLLGERQRHQVVPHRINAELVVQRRVYLRRPTRPFLALVATVVHEHDRAAVFLFDAVARYDELVDVFPVVL